MVKAPQKRTLETRARLIEAAQALILNGGYAALRVEEVVLKAGVAKGTFFAHFADKDLLMDQLIGAELDRVMDLVEARPAPMDSASMADTLSPLTEFMTSERYVFDLILRYSGAAAVEAIGPIAMNFGRQVAVLTQWCAHRGTTFRQDIDAELLAEGVHAFLLQSMSLKFCALHNSQSATDRLAQYLQAWLEPSV